MQEKTEKNQERHRNYRKQREILEIKNAYQK